MGDREDKILDRLIRVLRKRQFGKVWKGKELEEFYDFLYLEGVSAGGFLISLPTVNDDGEEGWVWFFYKIAETQHRGNRIRFEIESPEVFVPLENEGLKEPPSEWSRFPIRRLQ